MGYKGYHTGFRTWKPSRDKLVSRPEPEDKGQPTADDSSFDQLREACKSCLPWEDVVFVVFEYLQDQKRQELPVLRLLLNVFSDSSIILLIRNFLLWIDVTASEESDSDEYVYVPIGEWPSVYSPTSGTSTFRREHLAPRHKRPIYHTKTSPRKGRVGNGRPKIHSRWTYERLHKRVWLSQQSRLLACGSDPALNLKSRKGGGRWYSGPYQPPQKWTFPVIQSRRRERQKRAKQFIHLNGWQRPYRDVIDEIC